MKILLVNKFFYLKGGSEQVFFDEGRLLEERGHKVVFFSMQNSKNFPSEYKRYFISNVDYEKGKLKDEIGASLKLLYSFEANRKMEQLIKQERPDVAHLHNIYHQISPSVLHSLKKYRIPVVMTLHDYKMVCASYLLFAGGRPCEACTGERYYNCFLKACVKDSRAKSFLNTVEMYLHHKMLRIYELVDVCISPSKFVKHKLEQMAFKGKIIHLPNFIKCDETINPQFSAGKKSIVYFGRLSSEKGLFTLLEAVKGLDVILKIIGVGPAEENLKLKAKNEKLNNINFLGYRIGEELKDEITKCMFAVLPSECYENNPRSVIEAFALGKPAIGARIGGIPELVKDNVTGLTFKAGDINDLREKIKQLINSPDKIIEMGKNARAFVEQELNPEKHYRGLMEIYRRIEHLT